MRKRSIYHAAGQLFYKSLTLVSPELNTRAMFWRVHRKLINLRNPSTFYEKILWLKLNNYNFNPLAIQCSDKLAVREYVTKCGHSKILNELYEEYETVDDIPWRTLPDQFALKWNFGCGFNIICDDKRKLDVAGAKRKLRKWGRRKYWLTRGEMFYKPRRKWIICERYLGAGSGALPDDYKFYCFNGKPEVMLFAKDRATDLKIGFVSMDWKYISGVPGYSEIDSLPPKPHVFDEMVRIASDLCGPFPFVRVDFYNHPEGIVFGELTLIPTGGHHAVQTVVGGKSMGEMLNLESGQSCLRVSM